MQSSTERFEPCTLSSAQPALQRRWGRRVASRVASWLASGAVVAAAMVASAPAAALPLVGPFTPGHIGPLDNQVALITGAHPGDSSAFYDLFTFSVADVSAFFALALDVTVLDPSIPPSESASLFAVALLDDTGALLALDETPADGFTLAALMPEPGVYGVLVGGVGGSGLGLYAALLSAETRVVPEPGAALLLLLGLAGLAGQQAARRRQPAAG